MNELKEKDIQFVEDYIWFDVPTERGGYEEWCVKKETILKIIGTAVQQPLSGSAETASPKCCQAYIEGYERGHNDTVESEYGHAEEKAIDWLDNTSDNRKRCAK